MVNNKVKKWILKAMEDYKTIQHEFIFPEKEIITSTVCFHSQQFVEKVLKAYLTYKKVDFKKTHNIDLLLKFCIEKDNEFKELYVGDLTTYAVEIRYPDEFYIPSLKEAKQCFNIVDKVKNFVFKKLKINENNYVK
jgi:HEPN domain-containing protein